MNMPSERANGNYRRAVPRPDIAVIKDDLATLKRDLAALFADLETSGVAGAGGIMLKAAGRMSGETVRFCDTVAAAAQTRSRELCAQVERRPLAMVLAACAFGVFVARMGERRPRRR
jgi:hypothetical protein